MIFEEPCSECGTEELSVIYEDEALGESGAFTVVCANCPAEFYLPAETTARTRIEAVRKIVRKHQAARVDGYLLDAFTAQMLLAVYNSLSPVNRERFGQPDLLRLVNLGWKHARVAS